MLQGVCHVTGSVLCYMECIMLQGVYCVTGECVMFHKGVSCTGNVLCYRECIVL